MSSSKPISQPWLGFTFYGDRRAALYRSTTNLERRPSERRSGGTHTTQRLDRGIGTAPGSRQHNGIVTKGRRQAHGRCAAILQHGQSACSTLGPVSVI